MADYVHTPSAPGLECSDVEDCVGLMVDIISKCMPKLLRNDIDVDTLGAALRDLLVDHANGRLVPFSIGILYDHYDEHGNQP